MSWDFVGLVHQERKFGSYKAGGNARMSSGQTNKRAFQKSTVAAQMAGKVFQVLFLGLTLTPRAILTINAMELAESIGNIAIRSLRICFMPRVILPTTPRHADT